jgi:hypothetical protein
VKLKENIFSPSPHPSNIVKIAQFTEEIGEDMGLWLKGFSGNMGVIGNVLGGTI